jgi:glutathione S-transferase
MSASSSTNGTESTGVVEYFDILSKRPISWTPFTARGRMVLNFKRIPHTTTWLSYPDLAGHLSALNIPPGTGNHFNLRYTSPALRHHHISGQADVCLQGSMPVALYLEQAFPDSPSLFPGPGALELAQLVDHTISASLLPASMKFVLPKIPAILDDRGAEYFHRTRREWFGVPLEELCPDPEAEWAALEKGLVIFSDLLNGPATAPRPHQTFLMGDTPSYADILLVTFFQWLKSVDEKDWDRAIALGKNGVFRRLWDSCEQWLQTTA